MSNDKPPYTLILTMPGPDAPPAGWYTLRYAAKAPPPPAWLILRLRLDTLGLVLTFTLEHAQWLNAAEAAAARAVPLPAGLALVLTEPPRG